MEIFDLCKKKWCINLCKNDQITLVQKVNNNSVSRWFFISVYKRFSWARVGDISFPVFNHVATSRCFIGIRSSQSVFTASHRQRWSRTNKHKYLDKRCIWGSMDVPCFWNILWLIYLVFTWNKHVANVKKTFSCAHTIQTVPKHANQIKLHLSLGFTKNLRRTILWEWLMALNH